MARAGTWQYKIVLSLPRVSRFSRIISTWEKKKISVHVCLLCMNLLQFGSYSLISFVVSKNLWNSETIYVSYPLHCLFPYSMILQQLKPFLMQSCHSLPFSSPLCPAQRSVTPLSLSTYSHITSGNKGGN